MMSAAKKVGRHGVRDAAIILLMFRHGLRSAELVALKWSQIDLVGGYIEVRRAKRGHDSTHPLRSPELRALDQLWAGGLTQIFMNVAMRAYRQQDIVPKSVHLDSSTFHLHGAYKSDTPQALISLPFR
jgi:integrase